MDLEECQQGKERDGGGEGGKGRGFGGEKESRLVANQQLQSVAGGNQKTSPPKLIL